MTTRFQTRTFLLCFVPFSILLAGSFWMVQGFVQSTVRDGLHNSLRESREAIATLHAKEDLQNSAPLKSASDNADLKAAIQLLLSRPKTEKVRENVENQLRVLGEHMGFDFMLVSAADDSPLAGVVRQAGAGQDSRHQLKSFDTALLYHSDSGFRVIGGRTFQIASVPIDQNDKSIGTLSAGKSFKISDFATPVVLVRGGEVIESNIPQVSYAELTRVLLHCTDHSECDVRLRGSNWISLPIQSYGGGYVLLSFENVDKPTSLIQSKLRSLFLSISLFSVMIAFLCSAASSNSIVKPIAGVVTHLRKAARTGVLSELEGPSSSIIEIKELSELYNEAAISVRAASENLESAYLEFVGSLVNALDARDEYTAGHSWRVSQLSSAIASGMHLAQPDIGRIRIGAMLHDIGKIGIPDGLLQKRGRLTDKETKLVKRHPVIGKKILAGVQGFAPFLTAVELHHENWDGSGYPYGQSGEETPIDARIVHVADAYDAMTSHRPYRRGLTHEEAISELMGFAGVQFDPQIVNVLVGLPREVVAPDFEGQKVREIRPVKRQAAYRGVNAGVPLALAEMLKRDFLA